MAWAVMGSLNCVAVKVVLRCQTCVSQKQAAQTRLMRRSHRCLRYLNESMFSGALNILFLGISVSFAFGLQNVLFRR